MCKTEYKTIRVRKSDYEDLLEISERSCVPIVNLIRIAIPKLKSKYRIKGEVKVDGD